jgi:hypothetical protein
MDFSDEQWKSIKEHWGQGVDTLVYLDDKGARVSWVHSPYPRRGVDLAKFLGSLPLPYRLDLGPGEKNANPETAGTVLDQLSKLTTLRELSVRYVPMKAARMKELGKVSGLHVRTLWGFKPETQDQLKPLAQLRELRWLSLSDNAVGDDSLVRLSGLVNLEELHLRGTNITSRGLAHLKGLKNLRVFTASGVDPKAKAAFRAEMPFLNLKGQPK